MSKYILVFFCTLLLSPLVEAQKKHEFVSIKEKTVGKRIELFAVNTSSISYDVFLMVETQDFRRSSSRPVLKTIPPNSEVKMITLIKLKGKEGKYTYTLVVNEVAYDLNVKKNHDDFEVKIDDALKTKKVTLFTKDVCDLCNQTKSLLGANYIKYDEFNIDRDSTQLIRLIKEYKSNKVNARTFAPILKIEDSLYTNIKTKEELITALQNHF